MVRRRGRVKRKPKKSKRKRTHKIPGMINASNGGRAVTPSGLYGSNYYKHVKNAKQFKKVVKKISSYENRMPSYRYKNQRPPRTGDIIPANETKVAPNGTTWQTKSRRVTTYLKDYEETDIFNDFDGNFFLEKIGDKYHCWINILSASPIDANGQPDSVVKHGQKICEAWFDDKAQAKKFALSSIAVHFTKESPYEDHPAHGKSEDGKTMYADDHYYHDVNLGCGAVEYQNILDPHDPGNDPHIIAHKDDTIVIDTARMTVQNTNGEDLTKYTSFASNFPPLYGGQVNTIDFFPTVGDKCDVDIIYIPRIK